jgi:hypothetical protein
VKLGKLFDRFEIASALEVVDDAGCRALAMMLRGREPITGVYEQDFMRCSLANLCHRTGVSYKVVTAAYRDWKRTEAVLKAAEHLPGIVESIALDAQNKEIPCAVCEGIGRVFIKTSGEDIDKKCIVCEGVGKVVKSGDAVARKQILEMMELAGRGVMNVDARGSNVLLQNRGESMEDTLKASRMQKTIEGDMNGVD